MRIGRHILLLLLAGTLAARAQGVDVSARTDSASYRIGEWIRLHVESRAPKAWKQSFPLLKDSVGRFEIVSAGETAEEESGEFRILRRDVTLIAFDTGSFAIPPIAVTIIRPNDTARAAYASRPIPIRIRGVEVDTTKSYRDITDVLHIPLTIWDYLLYAGIVLLAAAIAYFGYRWYKRKPEPAPAVEPEPETPPDAAALEELAALEQMHLWEQGEDKRYQSAVTEILRRYIERRYRVMALEMTSNELVAHLVFCGIGRETLEALNAVLQRADLTKFAKYHPTPQEHGAAMAGARRFVEATKPAEAATASAAALSSSPDPGASHV